MAQEIMIGRKVRFKRFKLYEGFLWAGEGKIIAETESSYKIRTTWFTSEWAEKSKCEEIISK